MAIARLRLAPIIALAVGALAAGAAHATRHAAPPTLVVQSDHAGAAGYYAVDTDGRRLKRLLPDAAASLSSAIGRLLDRLPRLRLDPAHSSAPRGLVFRKPAALHVLWGAE